MSASLSVHILTVSQQVTESGISSLARAYAAPVKKKRGEKKAPVDLSEKAYLTNAKAYRTKLGLLNELPAALSLQLGKVEEILAQYKPIDLRLNSFPYHYALQVVTQDCKVISYVFDARGDLSKLYIDDSVHAYVQSRAENAMLDTNRLILGLEDGTVLMIVNSGRDKAKRAFVIGNQSMQRSIQLKNPARVISFNAEGSLLLLADKESIAILAFVHQTKELPARAMSSGHGATYALNQDTVLAVDMEVVETELFTRKQAVRYVAFESHIDLHNCLLLVTQKQDAQHLLPTVTVQRLQYTEAEEGHAPAALKVLPGHSCSVILSDTEFNTDHPSLLRGENCVARNAHETRLVLCLSSNTIVMCDTSAADSLRIVKQVQVKANGRPVFSSWHPDGGFFVVFYNSGEVRAFDAALLPLTWLSEQGRPEVRLSLDMYLPRAGIVTSGVWMSSHPSATTERMEAKAAKMNDVKSKLALVFENGPVMILDLNVGFRRHETWDEQQFVTLRLQAKELLHAVEAMVVMDDGQPQFMALNKICTYIYRMNRADQMKSTIAVQKLPSLKLFNGSTESEHRLYNAFIGTSTQIVTPLELLMFLLAQYWSAHHDPDKRLSAGFQQERKNNPSTFASLGTSILQMCALLCRLLIANEQIDSAFVFAKEVNISVCYDMCYKAHISKGNTQLASIVRDIQKRRSE